MKKLLLIASAVGAIALLSSLRFRDRGGEIGTVFAARRGNLAITLTEGGSIEALESQEIRSEIKGHQGTKILSIVEEGYLVTEEDVKNGKILVELDSSDIKQRITTQDIQFQSTLASLTEAQQSYDIQFIQNRTDLKAAELKVRFARMDLEKFLGSRVTEEILREAGLAAPDVTALSSDSAPDWDELKIDTPRLARLDSAQILSDISLPAAGNPGETNPAGPSLLPLGTGLAHAAPIPPKTIDFARYAKLELLEDGEAKQKFRKLEDDLLVARSEHGVSKTQFEGSERLAQKGYVTRTTLQNEQIALQKNELKVQTAETARALFIKYEFPKTAEELLSKYDEALRLLERTKKEGISKLAQAQAKLKAAEGRHRIETEQRKELQEQLEKCTLRAMKSGLVVYGGGENAAFFGQEQIREGATVRERQPIITIPDMTQMSVKVKVHESHIKKVRKGMKAKVRVDAFPDEILEGEVWKVGVLPDSQNRWMNPDLKVYLTSVKLNCVRDWLKPGMSTKVEILVTELTNVVYVPIQAVAMEDQYQVCHVVRGDSLEKRVVQTGEFNDEFIEIREGLAPGEKVLLHPPGGGNPPKETMEKEETPAPAAGL